MYRLIVNLKTNKMKEQRLDCPYDFTSRCTMGSCDCKPKQELPTVNGSYGCVIETKKQTYTKEDLEKAFKVGFTLGYGSDVEAIDDKDECFNRWFKIFKNK